jgi:hypothetical protein
LGVLFRLKDIKIKKFSFNIIHKSMNRKLKFSIVSVLALVLLVQTTRAQDDILFRRYLINSGINGFFYGVAIDIIAESDGGATAGIPIISAGASALIPLMTNSTRTISSNSLVLSTHGKAIGWLHGFSLATLIGGENAWNGNNYKLTVGLGAVSSIGLGIIGNSLGKSDRWTEGQVAIYRHYGWIMPLSGISLLAVISDEPRLWGASDLIFAAGGYFLADKVYKGYPYTRGDVRSLHVISVLNGGLGLGILADLSNRNEFSRSNLIFPAVGILSGTLIGQVWLKNANLTPKQGIQTAYAATGGALLGAGIAMLVQSDNVTPYYVIPYLTGLGAYTIALESMKHRNRETTYFPDKKKNNWNIAFMPQNLFLNSKTQNKGYFINGNFVGMQPLFSASVRF